MDKKVIGRESCKVRQPAYLTVYLALVMTVILSLCLVLIEGVRRNVTRLEAECVVDVAMNSVFAEYHRELFRQYNLFAIDASYGSPYVTADNVEWRLGQYIDRNISTEDVFLSEITAVSILTDHNGAVFRKCAVDAIKDDVGVSLLEELMGWAETVNSKGLCQQDVGAQMEQADEEICAYDEQQVQISEKQWITTEVTNPTEKLNAIRRKGILDTVIPNPEKISSKSILTENLIGERMKSGLYNRGNMVVSTVEVDMSGDAVTTENVLAAAVPDTGIERLWERFLFQEYLLRYMGNYGQQKENKALDYQIEYLIAGKNSDLENLKSTANTLCALREAANVAYLFADEEKCLEAEVLATVLTTVLHIPEAASVFKYALLLGWSYAESLHDVEVLLAGGRIPLMKTDSDWYYSLEGALMLSGWGEESLPDEGLSYCEYLRIFMLFMDLDELTERAMSMVEADIRLTPGNENFRLDGCYDGLNVGVQLESTYGYQCHMERQRRYSLY